MTVRPSFFLLAALLAGGVFASAAMAQQPPASGQPAPEPGQGPLITMKLETNCNVRPALIYVEVDRPGSDRTVRVRMNSNGTATFHAPPGTKARAKQSDESTSIAIRGQWTEAENDGTLNVRCAR